MTRRWLRNFKWLALAALVSIPAAAWAQAIAEGGSPLYRLAVKESVLGLRGRGSQEAQQQATATPAGAAVGGTNQVARSAASVGISPQILNQYYYYCTNCAAYHLRTQPLFSVPQTNALPALRHSKTNAAPGNGNQQ